jgi:hypothetical protein
MGNIGMDRWLFYRFLSSLNIQMISGLIWVEIKQLWDCGLSDYSHNLWNILDFITNALYLCTFALRCVAYVQVSINIFGMNYFWIRLREK